MQPGDLRRFRDSLIALGADHVEDGTFVVLRVYPVTEHIRSVDILIDGRVDEGLGYFWVQDNSEALNASR
jgi:hypothetical protein